jgi:hypothetical protein
MMNAQELADLMQAKIVAQFGPPQDPQILEPYLLAMATAIVEYLQTKAKVNPGTFANGGGPLTGQGTIV